MRPIPHDHRSRAFTLVELLTVIAIVGILAAVLIPTVSKMRASARATTCLSNMRQIGNAMLLYAQDNGGRLPAPKNDASSYWVQKLQPYLGAPVSANPETTSGSYEKLSSASYCPDWWNHRPEWSASWPDVGYAMSSMLEGTPNSSLAPSIAAIKDPSRALLLIENPPLNEPFFPQDGASAEVFAGWYFTSFNEATGVLRHESKANYLFTDGHVKGMNPQEAKAYFPTP